MEPVSMVTLHEKMRVLGSRGSEPCTFDHPHLDIKERVRRGLLWVTQAQVRGGGHVGGCLDGGGHPSLPRTISTFTLPPALRAVALRPDPIAEALREKHRAWAATGAAQWPLPWWDERAEPTEAQLWEVEGAPPLHPS